VAAPAVAVAPETAGTVDTAVANPAQADADGDGAGDACDKAPEPDMTGPVVRVLRASATPDRDGRVTIRLACPDDETRCRGTLVLGTDPATAGRPLV